MDQLLATSAQAEQNGRLARIDDRRDQRHDGHDARFQRARRLRSTADFARTRQQGRRVTSPHLTLIYARQASLSVAAADASGTASVAPNAPPAPTRIGFAISKRVGDAVRRNLVKRRLREHIRRALWQIAPGWDMILGARPGAAQADDATLGAETLDVLARARLLRNTEHEEPFHS